MKIESFFVPGPTYFEPDIHKDNRGYFLELFHKKKFKDVGITKPFVQDNVSVSKKGVLRGLHYQIGNNAQSKLVMVLEGEIFDVAVDIRPNSITFGQYIHANLNSKLHNMLYIPAGFAHGFLTLSDKAIVMYKCDNFYSPGNEFGIRWDDPTIKIEWPKLSCDFILSEKDSNAPFLGERKNEF